MICLVLDHGWSDSCPIGKTPSSAKSVFGSKVGHNSWAWAYGPGGVMDWMFAQQRPTPAEIPGPVDE